MLSEKFFNTEQASETECEDDMMRRASECETEQVNVKRKTEINTIVI